MLNENYNGTISLIEQIHKTFSHVSPPEKDDIVSHSCYECELLKITSFNNSRGLNDEIIEADCDKLQLLSHRAFQYYLPYFLCYALRDFNPYSSVCQYTIFSLSPGKLDDNEKTWWKERFQLFTHDQMEVIFKFLDQVTNDESFYDFHTIVDRGKRRLQEMLNENKDAGVL